MRITLISMTTAVALALLVAPAGAVAASQPDDDLQQRIDLALVEFPGGVQSASNEITWGDGEVTLTLSDPDPASGADPDDAAARSIGSCATGAHCVYSSTNLQGDRLSFSSCATASVAPLGSAVRSIANSGDAVVRAYNDLGAVGSVGANSWQNTSWSITKIGC
ncbi:peptidase inhibitor family I36 protein [Agromyces sp. NPDC058110]|uniref:peptidase inhibitor family I36 protein n=1 Tax=Agromyces sp. NPDC058110 TaxID=3346345 RepID=UPI0036D92FC3